MIPRLLSTALASLILSAGPAQASTYFTRQDNTSTLDLAGAWSAGGPPTSTTGAKWDSTVVTHLTDTAIGAAVNWGQIQILNPSGAVTIPASSYTLTLSGLGSSPVTGIDMSSASQNLTFNQTIALGASQTWNVASGRTLTIGAVDISGSSKSLTLTGLGTLTFSSATVAKTFNGGLNLNSGSCTLDLSSMTTPTDLINNANVLTLGTSTGFTGPSLTLKGKGSAVTSQTFASTTLNLGNSAITLTQNSATSLTAALGAITRTAGATLNFPTTPNTTTVIATTSTGNDASGILGTWASVNSGTSLQYASVNGSSQIISYAGATTTAQPANLSDVTSATGNYSFGATVNPTLTGNITANTLRCTASPASTLANGGFTMTFNGLMNASSTGLTISGTGNLVIGANKELVIMNNASTLKLSPGKIVDNGAGASSLVCNNIGAGTVYVVTINNTYSGGTVVNGGTLRCQPSGAGTAAATLGTGTVTVNNATFFQNNGAVTYANTFVLNNSTASAGDNDLNFSGTVTLYGNNTTTTYVGHKVDFQNVLSGSGGLTAYYNTSYSGNVITELDAANTYTGNTYITGGSGTSTATLKLGASGSINNTPLISIGANGTFDVSAISSYTLSSSTTLSAAGTSLPATIKGASSGTVSLGSRPIILSYDGSHVPLTISQGALSLNANPITVNGSTLLTGAYNIVSQTTGSISSSGTYPGVNGTAIPAGKIGYITTSGTTPGFVTLNIGVPTLTVSGFPSTEAAGVAGSVTVTAKDPNGNTATAYTGTVHFTSSDAQAVVPSSYTFVPSDNGTHTFSVTLKTAASQSITATDSLAGASASQTGISVTPAAAASLVVSGFPNPTTASASGGGTVTAKDAYGNTATGYAGTIHFTSSDGAASLPSDYTFGGGDNGTQTFAATLNTVSPPNVSITATDTLTGTIAGSQTGIVVNPSTIAAYLTVTGITNPLTAGNSSAVSVTAHLASGATATGYTGTIHFTSTDGAASLPSDYTFVSGDNGTTTLSGVDLKTGGTQSVTAADTVTLIHGSQTGITVTPASAATLTVAGFPSPEWVGTAGGVTVTAHDAYGNIATGYTGTVHFNSSDGGATLPSDYTFVSGDNGAHTFTGGVTFSAAGTQSITATDTFSGTITGTQSGITVNLVPSVFTWKNAAAGTWIDAANWTNDAGVVAAPDIAGKANYTLNFTIAGTYTATDNVSAGFLLNQLNLTGATVAGNSLAFTTNIAAPPQINQSTAAAGTINNDISLGTDTTVGVTGGGLTLNGLISGTGGLLKTGGGTLTVTNGSNNYSGPIHISGGTFFSTLGGDAGFGTGGAITLESGAAIQFNGAPNVTNAGIFNGGTVTSNNGFGASWGGPVTLNQNVTVNTGFHINFNGIVSGAGGFIKTGADVLNLTAANTFSGAMTVQAGSVSVASLNSVSGGTASSNLGAPTTVANGTIALGSGATAATLYYHGTGETTDRVLNLSGTTGGATVEQAGASGLLKFTSALTASGAGAKTLTLQGSTAGTGELGGAIVDSSGGATALVKTGTGTWTLSGSNPYTGATAVNGGTLLISGTNSGPGAVSVASTATLGGTGAIGGNVTYAGGALARFTQGSPLAIAGTLTSNNNVVHLVLPADLAGGTYTLATYLASGSTGSFNATPVIDSGSLATGATASVTTGSGLVKLVVSGGSDYNTWANNYPGYDLSNPAADTIGNGLTNGQKYAFGLNPTSFTDVNPIKVTLDKTAGTFTYTRRATPATTGVVYTVWTSTDLGGWNQDTGAIEGTTTVAGEVESVPVTLSGAPLSATTLFVRVQAVLP